MLVTDFIVRCLLMVFGYAYPAFQCFKTVEKNKVEMEELRFWCQYWIIVAFVTVLERITDGVFSWFPFYSEMKLAFVIYLWHPKTKGTRVFYEGLLRPVLLNHENDIDRKIMELKARLCDLFATYFQTFARYGQVAFFQFLQTMASQSGKFSSPNNNKAD